MKIKTKQYGYGGLINWTAIDNETYDYDSYVGVGNTEDEAIQDLMEKLNLPTLEC